MLDEQTAYALGELKKAGRTGAQDLEEAERLIPGLRRAISLGLAEDASSGFDPHRWYRLTARGVLALRGNFTPSIWQRLHVTLFGDLGRPSEAG